MSELALAELTARLHCLERRNLRTRAVAASALAALAALVLVGAAQPRIASELRAQRIVLTDEQGRPRAEFGVDRSGSASLKLMDRAGRTRATLGAGFGDEPSFVLNGEDGRGRAVLQLLPDGAGSLRLADGSGAFRTVIAGGLPGLSLLEGDGTVRVELAAKPEGPRLAFYDAAWKAIWRAP